MAWGEHRSLAEVTRSELTLSVRSFTEAQAHPQTHPAPPTSTAKVTPALVISYAPHLSRAQT